MAVDIKRRDTSCGVLSVRGMGRQEVSKGEQRRERRDENSHNQSFIPNTRNASVLNCFLRLSLVR
jgi:hypothetical protein